ncbi:MAG TPA: cation diffusion facilitator family transporter [Blastocatellia bacterium]|nr:cation diffusion facilitator family transporter [Blastocatellia bacterium]
MAHEHRHDRLDHSQANNRKRLAVVMSLTVAYMLAELIGGFLTNSLALLSDAGHMLADVAALGLAMLALWFSARPITPKKTYGYYRLEILAALANGVALVVISLLIFYEAWHRIRNPEAVDYRGLMLIASGGLAVNLISAWLLHSASESNLNVRGAFLHVLGDALGSVGAVAAGFIIWQWGWTMADPIFSVAMCLMIIYSSWQLIRESVNILLEGTPSHINIRAVIEAMHEVEGVAGVHDLHVWTISSGKEALSAHVTLDAGASHRATLEALQHRLQSEFNIGHVTIQIELPDEAEAAGGRLYQIVPRERGREPGVRGQAEE